MDDFNIAAINRVLNFKSGLARETQIPLRTHHRLRPGTAQTADPEDPASGLGNDEPQNAERASAELRPAPDELQSSRNLRKKPSDLPELNGEV